MAITSKCYRNVDNSLFPLFGQLALPSPIMMG